MTSAQLFETPGRNNSPHADYEKIPSIVIYIYLFFFLILFQILDMVKPKVEGTVGFLFRKCGIILCCTVATCGCQN